MFADGNKNLIVTYAVTILICAGLIFVIINFNTWFFPNTDLARETYTPSSRGMLSEKDLKIGVLSDKKFTSLQPILGPDDLSEASGVTEGVTKTVTPTVKPVIQIRHANPFNPF